ncbi:ulp1 protease family, C-terminal catalytic domain-containing protein [Tanacetum coccineum]|uniref:Ulp1 protease family, C-terminal catalytic domain-containing protein n=2 Tax=Tanacetum coccineum TaxID=301880 RepID=A0ABQ5D506_9ASTR
MKKPISGISLETSKKKHKAKKKMQKKAVQGKITKFFNKEDLQKTNVLKAKNKTKFKKRSSKRLGCKSSVCKFKDFMFLTSIRRKKKSSGHDSLSCFKKRRLNSENYPKTRKLIDEFNLEEVFGENVKVCGYRRNEDVNQNVHNREYLDVISIDVEVERVKNDAQMKDIIDIGFGSLIGMATEEIPVYDKIQESQMGGILFKLNFLVLFSNAMCLKMSKINWIRDCENSYYSRPLTALTLMSLFSTKCDSISVPRQTPAIKYWSTELIKKREIFEICNGGFGLLHLYSDDSSDDILEREFESKMDKLDQKVTLLKLIVEDLEFQFSNTLVDHPNSSRLKDIKAKYNGIIRNTDLSDFAYAIENNSIHHENQYGNDFSETDYSLNFNDMSGNYNDGECSHGVEELDKNFINETDEENGEDSSEEEMTEEVNQKVIEADIVLQKSINDDIQNKEQNSIDEDFQKLSEVVCIVEKLRESNIQNEEQMFVKGTNEEKEEEILNQDVSVVNVLKVIEADSISEKSREDEFNGFKVNKETSFDFKIFDTPKVDDKGKSAVRGLEDCLNKGLFRQVAEPDNSIRSFGNPFRVSTNDMPKHRLDEPPSFSLGPEFDETKTDCSQKEKQSLDRIQTVSFRPESEIDVLKEDIKPDIRDASIRLQPKREASVAWYLKSPFKVRGSALNTSVNNLTQTEVLTADTLFIMDEEESDPVEAVYSSCTTNVKIPRIFLESLAPGLKIEQPVIDAWADLLNFNERYKSTGSPSRYFFKPILTNRLKIEDFISAEDRFYKFEECIRLCDYDTKRMLNSDKMFHLVFFPVCTLDHFFLICFHMKSGKVVIIDNSTVEDDLTPRQRYLKLPQELISVFDKYISKNSPGRVASIFRNVEPERLKMKWRTCENELDNGVFLMSHMDNYFGEAENKWDYGFCKESKEQTKQLKFLRSKYAARILLSENNSYKDEFQKEVDKVRSIHKNRRRELIEEAVMRRPAKVDEYFGY